LTTRETVAAETPARRAMSRMVKDDFSESVRPRMDLTKVPTLAPRVKPGPGGQGPWNVSLSGT